MPMRLGCDSKSKRCVATSIVDDAGSRRRVSTDECGAYARVVRAPIGMRARVDE